MSLLTDSDVLALADLQAIDSEVAEVAAICDPPIPLEGDGSAIREAWSVAKDKLLAGQQIYGSSYGIPPGSSAVLQAVMYGVTPGAVRSRLFAEQIVIEDGTANSISPLKRWMAYLALHLFYKNAADRLTKEDRFERKADSYGEKTRAAWSVLSRIGLSVIRQPLSAPGAVHDSKAMGTVFDSTALSTVTGGAGAAVSADFAITWVNVTGTAGYVSPSQPNKCESATSARVNLAIPASSQAVVSIANLVAPDGNSPYDAYADGLLSPLAATHWNVYAGQQGGTLFLQNSSPIPVGTHTWTGYPVFSGWRASAGQPRDLRFPFRNLFHRA